jgi:hypothetical protein
VNTPKQTDSTKLIANPEEESVSGLSRRSFFKRSAMMSAGLVAAGGIATLATTLAKPALAAESAEDAKSMRKGLTKGDLNILIAAQIAEALAVTTYSNIIDSAPFFQNIPNDDQGYLIAAREEEMSHYLLEQQVTDQFVPFTSFYYPMNMFADAQVTLNTLVTLEDAFVAAYLVGVRNFSTTNLRVTAARIMGIESDHRTLARVVAGDVTPQNGGPLTTTTGIQGVAESIAPPNNNGYDVRCAGTTSIRRWTHCSPSWIPRRPRRRDSTRRSRIRLNPSIPSCRTPWESFSRSVVARAASRVGLAVEIGKLTCVGGLAV